MRKASIITYWLTGIISALLLSGGMIRCNVVIFPHIGSHFQLASILADTLYDRGHSVTVVAPNFCFSGRSYRYNIVPYTVLEHELEMSTRYFNDYFKERRSRSIPTSMPGVVRALSMGLFKHSDVILKSLRHFQFQVAIVDSTMADALVLVAKLNLPHIMLSVSRFDVHLARLSDASLPLSYVPVGRQHNGFTHEMTFMQRATNFWLYFYQSIIIKTNRGKMKELRDLYFPEMTNMDTDVALRNTTLWLINTDFNLEFPYPVMPNVKYVGSFTARPPTRLPKDLEEFIAESGDDGIILFSLSTILPLSETDMTQIFLEAFSTLTQRVIWRGETIQGSSDSIMFSKWIPQNDVLGSSKTRVLVSHGGLSGVQEAMYHGVPMVIVPMFSDQPDNAIRVEAHGYGVRLDPFNLTAASIVAAVKSVISDKRMADRMRDLSQKLKFDQSYMSAREMAAFWVEDVMKYGHLYPRPANQDLSYIQSHGLDVVAVFALICFVGVMALTKLGRMIFPKIIRSSESKMKGV